MKFLFCIILLSTSLWSRTPNAIISKYSLENNLKSAKRNKPVQFNLRFKTLPDNGINEHLISITKKAASIWEEYAYVNFNFETEKYRNSKIDIFIEIYSNYVERTSRLGRSPHGLWDMANKRLVLNLPKDAMPADQLETALHEFGHVLGLSHEHQHPNRNFSFNEELIKTNCEKATFMEFDECMRSAEYNKLRVFTEKNFLLSRYDIDSIMHYPLKAPVINEDITIKRNTELSLTDKLMISEVYPGRISDEEIIELHQAHVNKTYGLTHVGLCELGEKSYASEQTYSYHYASGEEAWFLAPSKAAAIINAEFDPKCTSVFNGDEKDNNE